MSLVVITDYTFPDTEIERVALEAGGARLRASRCKDRAELIALVGGADAVITQFARIDAEVIAAMDRAKVIARYGIGVDNVDLEAARARGIPVCNVPDYCIDEVADHTLALSLDLTRRISAISAHLRTGTWSLPVELAQMRALSAMTVGVVGFGRIGRAVSARLRACGARVLVSDPVATAEAVAAAGCAAASLDTLLAAADLITLHCPSTPATRRLLDADRLGRCRRGVLVVNAGRGDLVDTPALVAALASGQVGAAALDTCDPEPIPAGHPLLSLPQVIITPHAASCSVRAASALRQGVIAHALRAVRGEPARDVVNGVRSAASAAGR
jgi:D-3-phosphoglycerate dehydrogenase